ncbi:hypothetical protein ACFY2Z_15550 [Streptomyces sp. NPDC001222]|uniref:hypothetical protein n=1 Tax=Streptomyces sp. NPDC001222 TaxID=3364548 RepID=UPI0036B5CA65
MGALPALALFRPGLVAPFLCVLLVFPLVVLLGAKSEPSTGVGRCCDALGKASYCVYVLHRPLGALVYAAALQFTGQGWKSSPPGAVWSS